MPNDIIFELVHRAVSTLVDWDINSEQDFERNQGEMADSMVPHKTHKQVTHYQQFPDYAESAKVDNLPESASLHDCITMGYYLHASEILSQVWEWSVTND
jgi:hypothetical protein